MPLDWRQALVRRPDLDRFLFAPEDVVVAVGQDGLVANVAKYLDGQPVVGVNPAPDLYDGVLARARVEALRALLPRQRGRRRPCSGAPWCRRPSTAASGCSPLNEIFVGHRSHQSARYRIDDGARAEDHSSSGLIVASGTA